MKEIPNRVMLSEAQLINVRKQYFHHSSLKDFNLNLNQHNTKDNHQLSPIMYEFHTITNYVC